MDDPISNYLRKEQGGLLIIVGNHEFEKPCTFGRGIYFSLFYCLCYVKKI